MNGKRSFCGAVWPFYSGGYTEGGLYIKQEALEGQNQYFCQKLVDAKRVQWMLKEVCSLRVWGYNGVPRCVYTKNLCDHAVHSCSIVANICVNPMAVDYGLE